MLLDLNIIVQQGSLLSFLKSSAVVLSLRLELQAHVILSYLFTAGSLPELNKGLGDKF